MRRDIIRGLIKRSIAIGCISLLGIGALDAIYSNAEDIDTTEKNIAYKKEEVVEATSMDVKTESVENGNVEEQESVANEVTQGGLVDIASPDNEYTGGVVKLDSASRQLVERKVMGENHTDMISAAMVAQCIRDTMVETGINDVSRLFTEYQYSGNMDTAPNEDVKRAVSFVFDNGGYAVKHRVMYFYAPEYCNGSWHETQNFVVEYAGHRVFDRVY